MHLMEFVAQVVFIEAPEFDGDPLSDLCYFRNLLCLSSLSQGLRETKHETDINAVTCRNHN